MANGDRLTCEIKRLSKAVLYLSLDYVDGAISVDWRKVASLESKQLFVVQTQGGLLYSGTIKSMAAEADRPVEIEVAEDGKEYQVQKSHVVELAETSERFIDRFSVSVDSGLIYSKANQNTQYNFGASVKYLRQRWSAELDYSSALSGATFNSTSSRNSLSLTALRLLPQKNYFYSGFSNFLQSSEQGIDLQSSVGATFGKYLKNTNASQVALFGGLAWQGTSYVPTADVSGQQNAIAGIVGTSINLFRFKKTQLTTNAQLFPLLNQPGRVRFNINSSYAIQIVSNLWWRFTFYGNWDNRPPSNLPGSDYGTTSGIQWSFN